MKKNYWQMNVQQLRAATAQFDEPMVEDSSRPLTAKERDQWNRLKGANRRSKRGNGCQRISVSIERTLLKRATAFAKRKRLSRSRLVAIALEQAIARQRE